MVACGRKREASRHLLHRWCNTLGFRGWRDESGEVLHHVACSRKRLVSECLLHCWCNTLGFWGLRDVTGEMLHHGVMPKEGLVSICCIWVNVATNGYKPCQWDRTQFWGGRIVTVASWVMVATVLQQTTHKRRGREGDYNSRKCCKITKVSYTVPMPLWCRILHCF